MDINLFLKNKIQAGKEIINEFDSKEILKEIGIPIPNQKLVSTKEELIVVANEIGYPIVMKLITEDIAHKSEMGAVKLNIKNKEEAINAFNELMNITSEKEKIISIQKMAEPPITEIIIGMTTDPEFGPALMFGIGGLLVELLDDVSFRIIPVTEYDCREMITEIKGFPLLTGFRGRPKVNIDAIINILMKISEFVLQYKSIQEIDLNPIFVYQKELICVDARIILKS